VARTSWFFEAVVLAAHAWHRPDSRFIFSIFYE
jgi:hypothetical protein